MTFRRRARHASNVLGISTFVLCVGLSGCTAWPPSGGGGLAERQPVDSPLVGRLLKRFDSLERLGAQAYNAGRMKDARLLIARAQREIAGGLDQDSLVSFQEADRLLSAIERDIAHSARVQKRGG